MKIDHIAIAVNNVEDSAKTYKDALGVEKIEFETVESEGVKLAIIHLENGRIELMEPMNDESPIKKFLEKKGQGLHHIAARERCHRRPDGSHLRYAARSFARRAGSDFRAGCRPPAIPSASGSCRPPAGAPARSSRAWAPLPPPRGPSCPLVTASWSAAPSA